LNQEFLSSEKKQIISIENNILKVDFNTKGAKITNVILNDYYDSENNLHSDQSKAFRANYAGIGQFYDRDNDVFHAANVGGESWVLNTDGYYYEPPVAYPSDGHKYNWHEDVTNWVKAVDSSELDIDHP
jgi:hypothetical protein